MNTFSGNLTLQGQHYSLNGGMNFGNTYDLKGLTRTQLTNGVMTVVDLEVYAASGMLFYVTRILAHTQQI